MNNNVSLMIAQLETLQNLDIKAFVQAIVALETNNFNQNSLDELYEVWLDNEYSLISEMFERVAAIG